MTLFVLLIGIFKKLKEKKPKVQLPKQVQQLFSKVQHKQAGLQLVLRPNSDILANISEFKCGTLNVPCQAAKPPEYLPVPPGQNQGRRVSVKAEIRL